MKRPKMSRDSLPWVLFAVCALALLALPVALASVYAPRYGFFRVPFASWFVFGLVGASIALGGTACTVFWWRFRRAGREILDLTKQPLVEDVPAVYGHRRLGRAEFVPLIQILLRRFSDVRYVQVRPLPGGYGGSTTVLAELRRERAGERLPRSFVIKLGDREEMAHERDKYRAYVEWQLTRGAHFVAHAEWEGLAGIAYEFVGLDTDHEVQSFFQFYQGHATVEVSELVGEISSHLERAWYQSGGRVDGVDLCHEYDLLSKKRDQIVERIEGILDKDDAYRRTLTTSEGRTQPILRPSFCAEMDIPWRDPVTFLRMWSELGLRTAVYRSVVHGDLNARNVLIEIGGNGRKYPWFIDFSHTGNGLSGHRSEQMAQEGILIDDQSGHTLRDFCRLEADIKFVLTRLLDEDDLRLVVAFERALMDQELVPDGLPDTPLAIEALTDVRFHKAWHVIKEIRLHAAKYVPVKADLRPFHFSLLHATLPVLYYHSDQFENELCERQQKRYALISAGMLCSQLWPVVNR